MFTRRSLVSKAGIHFEPILVSIEGNIGSGKSILLGRLSRKYPEWNVVKEPVDTWSSIQNEGGESLLEVFYRDRQRWSYTFQNCALLTRHQTIEASVNSVRARGGRGKHIFLTERCLETDYQVFTKMLRDENSIDGLEYDLYKRWLAMLKKTATPLSAIVHVTTDPLECVQRIKSRARKGEESVPLEYLQSLEAYQDKWISSLSIPSAATDLEDDEAVETFIAGLQ